MTIYSLFALVGLILWFDETNKDYHISKLRPGYVVKHYLVLLKSPLFMGIALSTFLSNGAFFSWFVVGPVLLIDKIDIDPVAFGWLTFVGVGMPYILAGYLNGKLVKNYGMASMMRFGWSLMTIGGLLMLLGYFIAGLNIWIIMLPMVLFSFGSTFIWPNAFVMAFTPFGHIAGYAGSLYSFMLICGASVISGLAAYLPDESQLAYAIIIIASSVGAWVIFEIAYKRST